MINKVFVNIYFPMSNQDFFLFLPVNELVWRAKALIVKSIYDLNDSFCSLDNDYILINKNTGKVYEDNDVILNTDIRNCTELLLIKII